MKVVACTDDDAQLLLLKMQKLMGEQRTRHVAADKQVVVEDVHRGVHYVLVEWLQAQGFKVP